ncbi:MAG: signal recognition particle protein, partial [Clostridia bacterium]|nr:signal recognition particle protein [Clostridia bacterium]
RRNPKLLNASRRKRIAAGSGTTVQDVNQLIRQFENAKDMMKKMTAQMKGGKGQRMMRRFPGFK